MTYLKRFMTISVAALLCAAACTAWPPALYARSASLTTKEEEELGRELMLQARKYHQFVEDPFIVDYVNQVGQKIVAQIADPVFDYHFYVLKEDVYNAFAAPAGHIFINSGLIAAMDREEELAGILGHEIAHVLCRHISKRIDQSQKIGLATMAGVLAGIFMGGDPAAAGAITSGSIAAGQSFALKYSRENEAEADQVGLKYLAKAGYSGEGLLKTLEKIRSKRWFGPEDIPSYLSTHPAVEERLAYLDTWIQANPGWGRSPRPADDTAFHKARFRLIALYVDARTAHNEFDSLLRKTENNPFALYGKGLLLNRDGKKEEALDHLKKAIRARPLDTDILRDLGKTYFHMGDYPNALKSLRGALAFDPKDTEGWFLLGRAQTETGDHKGALQSFNTVVAMKPDYLPGLYHLGETYGRLGSLGEAHYYLGMYYKKKGERKNAEFHLERAINLLSGDDPRRVEAEEALKELSGDQKGRRSEKTAW